MKISTNDFLTAFGAALTLFLFTGCQEQSPAIVISTGNFASLEEKFHELTKDDPPMKSLTVVARANDSDIQFFRSASAVHIDFPLFTDRQKALESDFRKICSDLGLTIRERSDPEGNRTLDAGVGSDSVELARFSRKILEDLFDVDEDSELEFTLFPLVK